jgi:hypothetical protein
MIFLAAMRHAIKACENAKRMKLAKPGDFKNSSNLMFLSYRL